MVIVFSMISSTVWAHDVSLLVVGNSYTGMKNAFAHPTAIFMESEVPTWHTIAYETHADAGLDLWTHKTRVERSRSIWATWWDEPFKWDLVILQEEFSSLIAEPPPSRHVNGAAYLVDHILERDATPFLLLPWARVDVEPHIYNPGEMSFVDQQAILNENLLDTAEALALTRGKISIIPTGWAMLRLYEDDLARGLNPLAMPSLFRRCYEDDGRHLNRTGVYMGAAVNLAAITGRSPTHFDLRMSDVHPVDAVRLKQIAHDVVFEDPFSWPAHFVRPWDDFVSNDQVQISDQTIIPWVKLQEVAQIDRLRLGGPSGGAHLTLDRGALLEANRCTIRTTSEVVQHEGEADIGHIHLEGRWALGGGQLSATVDGPGQVRIDGGHAILSGTAQIKIHGGTLTADGLQLDSLHLPEGARLNLSPHAVDVAGVATLSGIVSVDPAGGQMLVADRIDWAPEAIVGSARTVWLEDGRQALIGRPVIDAPDTGVDPPWNSTDTATPPTEPAPDSAAPSTPPTRDDGKRKGDTGPDGCHGGGAAVLVFPLVGLLRLRRRWRSATGSR